MRGFIQSLIFIRHRSIVQVHAPCSGAKGRPVHVPDLAAERAWEVQRYTQDLQGLSLNLYNKGSGWHPYDSLGS